MKRGYRGEVSANAANEVLKQSLVSNQFGTYPALIYFFQLVTNLIWHRPALLI